MFSEIFKALASEAMFTKDILGEGATQIRKGNYAQKGKYFQSFTSLSTGLERIGKLCLMLDYYIENGGVFPDLHYLKKEIGHDIELIYQKSKSIVQNRGIGLRTLRNLDGEIHQNIIKLLSAFAKGDRYSNINILVNSGQINDPVSKWFDLVDLKLFDRKVPEKKKQKIIRNAQIIDEMLGNLTMVRHSSETGANITSMEEASYRTGLFESVAPYRQLFVLQIIRYWVELIRELQYIAMREGGENIPFFSEIFAPFYNDDSYLRRRKTWDKF